MAYDDILFPGVLVDALSGSIADTQNFILEFSQLTTSGSLADIGFYGNYELVMPGSIYELSATLGGGARDYDWIS